MKKWIVLSLPVVFVLLMSFDKIPFLNKKAHVPNSLKYQTSQIERLAMVLAKDQQPQTVHFVPLKKSYHGFKEALGFKESQNKYDTVNSLGYLGKYQFGKSTLRHLGVNNPNIFLQNAALQEAVFYTNVARNKWILRREIKYFTGKKIKGTVITESGMVAAAHLAGAGNVKKYLYSYGKNDVADVFGSSVAFYMRHFKGYNLTAVTPQNTVTLRPLLAAKTLKLAK